MNATLTPPDSSLPALLAKAALGDASSFARLYDVTSPRIHGLVLRVVRDPSLAERVTREVFLHAWLNAHQYQAPSCPVTWLMTSAHRHAVDSVRTTETAETGLTPLHRLTSPVREPGEQPTGTSQARTALAALPLDEREALELAYFGGYTHSEVAVLVGAPAEGARSLIRDGLLRLQDALPEPA